MEQRVKKVRITVMRIARYDEKSVEKYRIGKYIKKKQQEV